MTDRSEYPVQAADPLVACIAQLAERFGVSFAPAMLAALPHNAAGLLPLHQAEPAFEVLGLNCHASRATKLATAGHAYPAIVALQDAGPVVVHEARDTDLLVWRPSTGQAAWEPAAAIGAEFASWMATVFGDPTVFRDGSAHWQERARGHWFWSELQKRRRHLGPVLIGSVLVNLLAIALPLFSMNVYDRVIPNRAQATLWVLAIGVILAIAIDFALRRSRAKVLDEIGRELDIALSQKIYSKILSSPLAMRQGHTGNLVARVTEFAIVRDFFASTTVMLMIDLVFLVLFLGLIAWLAGWLALVPLVMAGAMGAIGLRLRHRVISAAREAQADHGLQQTMLVESIAGMETLKSIGGEGMMLGRWRQLAELGSLSQQRLRDISSAATTLASTCQQLSNIALIVGGYYLFAAGQITMGAIIAIVMLSSRSLSPAAQLAFLLSRGQQARQTLDSLQKLWEEPDERRMGSATLTPQVRSANIRLESLEFAYPDTAVPSLAQVDLEIRPGDKIAVIGRVASGKSTLGRVLCGLYEPTGGAMLVEGVDSRQFRPQDLREAFRFVGQDAALFSGSIKDNLMLGAGRANDQELIDALRRVAADQFLARDESGFDRGVGEGGGRLSGGQRSFVSLARALVTPCKLLFLDEPTGSMDSQTEKLFVERLSQYLTDGQTLVISTHRPALFAVCNRIVVLDNGRIVADGPKEQVLASAGGLNAGRAAE